MPSASASAGGWEGVTSTLVDGSDLRYHRTTAMRKRTATIKTTIVQMVAIAVEPPAQSTRNVTLRLTPYSATFPLFTITC